MSYDYDLGNYHRPITTASPEAQRWFDRGLIWIYGYNHEEAVECFRNALLHDPLCVMAKWGIAYAVGPNYNRQWLDLDVDERKTFINETRQLNRIPHSQLNRATVVERGLISALLERCPDSPHEEDFTIRNDVYANAMRLLYQAYPQEPDVCALFAEALMNRTPWQLWNLKTGKPAEGADTLEAIEVLETAFDMLSQQGSLQHPGLLHMYLHLMEMSPHPEKALNIANRLIDLVPDAGHLQHMPTHIDVLCGDYQNVVSRNQRAIEADKKFLSKRGASNFYTLYRCHNYHFKIYGAMFLGQKKIALETASELEAALPIETLKAQADWLEAFYPMKQHVLIRFGMWQEIIAQVLPDDTELYAVTTCMMHYAKAVAYAATGDISAAKNEQSSFRSSRGSVPESRYLFNNSCLDILAVAEAMMDGEVAYREKKFEEAFEYLRASVELDDNLPYDEPWGWMQPTRHALGALLMEQDEIKEAESVYRADLGFDNTLARPCQHPGNVWSLHGLHECLIKQGRSAEAALLKPALDIAVARADVPIKFSCFCRGMNK